jgi:hypothetical protein
MNEIYDILDDRNVLPEEFKWPGGLKRKKA